MIDEEFFHITESGDEICMGTRNGAPFVSVLGDEHGDSMITLDEKSMRWMMSVLSQLLGEDLTF